MLVPLIEDLQNLYVSSEYLIIIINKAHLSFDIVNYVK